MQIIKFLLLRLILLASVPLTYCIRRIQQQDWNIGSDGTHSLRFLYMIKLERNPGHSTCLPTVNFHSCFKRVWQIKTVLLLQYLPVSLKSYARFTQNIYYRILLEMTCNNKNDVRYQGNLMLQLPIKHFFQTVLIQTCIPHFVGSKNNNLLSLTHFHALVNICLHLFINGHDKLNNFMSIYVIQYGNYIVILS